jgi:hypothetical protein
MAGAFPQRLWFDGFMLFVGLAIAIDPAKLARHAAKLLEGFSAGLRNFEQQAWRGPWRPQPPEPAPAEMTSRARLGWRIAGAALALLAFLGLAGFVG